MIEIRCGNCNKVFEIKPSRLKNSRTLYCSRKCHHKGMSNRREIACTICNKKVTRNITQIKNSKSGKFFCSKSCQTVWRNKKYRGEEHKNWKHGKSIKYRHILVNSGGRTICTLCENNDKRVLVVHHVDENRRNNNVENLAWLCHNCHHLVHYNKDKKNAFLNLLKKDRQV